MSKSRRLIHLVSATSWGGGEKYALDLCKSFSDEGWETTVYTRDAKVVDDNFINAGIDIRNIPLAGYYDLASAFSLSRHLKKEPSRTIIHTHKYKDAFTAIVARKLSGRKDIKILMTRHLAKKGKNSKLLRWIYRNLDMQIFVSNLAYRNFTATWNNSELPFDKNKVKIVHNSIMLNSFSRKEEPTNGPIIAMFHGRLSPEKGLENLIDALPALKGKRTRLWIVGTGNPDYVDSLKRKATELDVMNIIDWKGYTQDVHQLIPLCHFGILPSKWQEPFGLANIEYMANGRPQICSRHGAQPEYLTDRKEALFIDVEDIDSIKNAMLLLIDSPELRSKMGQDALNSFADNLQWKKFADKMRDIYCNL